MIKQLLFSLAFLAYASAFAQTSKLQLNVTDGTTGDPVSGATVLLSPGDFNDITNSAGESSIELSPNKYLVMIHLLGYNDYLDTVIVKGKDVTLNISLEQEILELHSVEVSALRAEDDAPFAKTNLKKEELVELNSGRDIPYVLEQTPSLVTTSDAGSGVGYTNMRIRGSDIARINVTVNGIPMNDPESHGVWWVNTPDLASSTSSMQLQRGVGTSTNGAGAFGASLNMETSNLETKPYGDLHFGLGSFNTQRATIALGSGLINEHWWVSGRLSKITSDGYVDRASSDLVSHSVTAGYINKKTSIRAVYFGGGEETYQAWNGVDSATFATNPTFNSAGALYDDNWAVTGYYDNEVDNYKQDHYQLHLNQGIGENLMLNVSGHYTYGRGYYEQYKQDQDMVDYNITPVIIGGDTITTTDLIRRKWLDNDFYGGIFNLNYSKDDWNVIVGGGFHQYEGRHYGEVIWARTASDSEIRDRYYESYSNKTDANIYAKADYLLNSKIKLFADLQVRSVDYKAEGEDDDVGDFKFDQVNTFFNPKLGLSYFVNTDIRAYASFAVANKEPNRGDLLYADPSDLPQTENLQDLEIGVDITKSKYAFQGNIFYMNYNNQLVLTGQLDNVGNPIRENVGKSYRAGLELIWGLEITSWLNWSANATFSRNVNSDYQEQQADGSVKNLGNTNIAYSPNVVAASNFQFVPVNNLSIDLFTKFVGEQYLSNIDNERHVLPSYLLNDLKVSYVLKSNGVKSVRFYVNAHNIFDVKYASNGYTWGDTPYYYSQAGVNFMGGIQLSF